MSGCNGCRRKPPAELCTACWVANDGCTGYCRDAFVYDTSMSDGDIVAVLRRDYIIGGGDGDMSMGVKVPQRILDVLAS
jgi:hypothetical protein